MAGWPWWRGGQGGQGGHGQSLSLSLLTLLTRGRGGPPPVPVVSLAHPIIQSQELVVKLRQGSGKDRQGKARMAKGERP